MKKTELRIVAGQVWDAVTAECRRDHRKYMAISYLGAGAAKLLDVRKGDCLVTDLSDDTVRSGATNHKKRCGSSAVLILKLTQSLIFTPKP